MKTEVHALGFHAFVPYMLFHALPRGSVSIVKTDFLDKLKRSANALRFTFDFRKAVYNSRYRCRAERTQGKPLQHK